MSRTVRVEHVGSVVRPGWLESAALRYGQGRVPLAQLRSLQDQAVSQSVAKQDALGLPLVTDGELRRVPLLASPPGTDGAAGPRRWVGQITRQVHDQEAAVAGLVPAGAASSAELEPDDAPLVGVAGDEYRFAQALTDRPVKISFLGPERTAQAVSPQSGRTGHEDFAELLSVVVDGEQRLVRELAADGCTHVQLDVPGYADYEDPSGWAALRGRGVDPLAQLQLSIQADNAVVAGLEGVTCGLHMCRRGNAGRWEHALGSDAVAERLLSQLAFDRLLVDYGDPAADFDQLRFLPAGKTVVLGLVSTTDATVETPDQLVRRLEAASRFVDLDQVAISPQCGFAGLVGARDVSEESQWAKLESLLETASRVWP